MAAFSEKDDRIGMFNIKFQLGDPSFYDLCDLWPELRTVSLQHADFESAEQARSLINEKMKLYKGDEKWYKFVAAAFKAAGLLEVTKDQLEIGTYTNLEIAESLRDNPVRLLALLLEVSKISSPAEKRSILSLAVEMM